MRTNCKKCDNLLVDGTGPRISKILILTSYPDFEDQRAGVLLSGSKSVLGMMAYELGLVGLQLSSIRYISLWKHSKNEKCQLDWHIDQSMSEIKGKTHVLVMGSDASKALFEKNSGDLSGLLMTHKLFPKVTFVIAPGPSEIYNSNVGELRLALTRFSSTIRK